MAKKEKELPVIFEQTQLERMELHSQRIRALEIEMAVAKSLAEAVSNMTHIVFGNGTPSLPEQVRNASAKVNHLEEYIKDLMKRREDNQLWWNRFIIGILIANILIPIIMYYLGF